VAFERDGVVRVLVGDEPAIEVPIVVGTRFNDAVCDRAGRVFAGVMPAAGRPGQLLRLEADHAAVQIADPLMPNGAGFSPDGTRLYFTDTLRRSIYAAPFDERTGMLGPAHVFARTPRGDGMPDGLAIDCEGGVWSARYDGSAVVRYDATGAETMRVPIPCTRPTGLAFGGPGLRDLYIATARVAGDAASGALFCVETSVVGVPMGRSRLFE
jgi:D-xylonolactonase